MREVSMNLLFVTSRLPFPPNRGDKVRTFMFLKELSRQHQVTLFSYIGSNDEKKYRKELSQYCKHIYLEKKTKLHHLKAFTKGFINCKPFQVNYYYFPQIRKKLEEIVKKHNIDTVYTHLIRMAPLVQNLPVFKILDYTDAISLEYKRSLPHRRNFIEKCFFSLEAKRTRKYEQHIISDFDEGWFISKEDIQDLEMNSSKVKLVPNPVKLSSIKTAFKLKNRLIFVGNMSVPHNIFAAKYVSENLMPYFKKSSLKFDIIGANPSAEIKALAGKNNTEVLGFVDDLFAELRNSDLFVAPMFYSAGVQNKVLEAMSVGLPVITSENVARSIGAKHNNELLVANTTAEYIEMIEKLLNNEELRRNIGMQGYKLIKNNFSLQKIRDILGNI